MKAKSMEVEGFDEPFLNMDAACLLPFAGGINALRDACNLWSRESNQHKAEAARKGLRHLRVKRGFWTTRSWVNDYILRRSK